LFAFSVGDCDTEDVLAQENAFGMVAKSTLPEISHESLRLIKPVVDLEVILDSASESSGTAFSVLHWVGHNKPS
jgi:hypothetical protein